MTSETAVRLSATIERAQPVLAARGDSDTGAPRIRGGWSSRQILGHLIDSAINNHQRFVRAAIEGKLIGSGYDQNACVRAEAFQEAPWGLLVETWTAMNRLIAHILMHLPAEAASVRCRVADDPEMSLDELARSYVNHLEHHLEQLGA